MHCCLAKSYSEAELLSVLAVECQLQPESFWISLPGHPPVSDWHGVARDVYMADSSSGSAHAFGTGPMRARIYPSWFLLPM
eukprot:8729925-Prorocentrum_lima.AAC.1